jgi:hypothetical protein
MEFFAEVDDLKPSHSRAAGMIAAPVLSDIEVGGDDTNPCTRTMPCKTWVGAIAQTAAGGEIDALDAGGFGAVTITKSITLDGGGGQVATLSRRAAATGSMLLRDQTMS